MIERFLFETPWWLLAVIAAAAVALLISGNRRQNRPRMLAGLAVLLMGVVIGLVSYIVETPRERAIRGTRELVQAAVDRNPALIQNDLHPQAALMHLNREDILHTLKTGSDAVGLRGARITGMETDVADSLITVRFRVMSDHDPAANIGYGTYLSTWELNWLETDQGWLLKDIVPIELGGQQVGQITRYLHRRGE